MNDYCLFIDKTYNKKTFESILRQNNKEKHKTKERNSGDWKKKRGRPYFFIMMLKHISIQMDNARQ